MFGPSTVLHGLRDAIRLLRNSPGFSAVAIATIALAIGANTAMFSFVNGILLRAKSSGRRIAACFLVHGDEVRWKGPFVRPPSELRPVSLLQDADQPLASAIVSSRDAASILVAFNAEARSDDSRSCVPSPVVQRSDRQSLLPLEQSMFTT